MNTTKQDVKHATRLVTNCQRDLRRELSNGERRDLLCDNTEWSSDYIRAIVGALGDCE